MSTDDLVSVVDREMGWAEQAWRQGQEGRARVCARRAAGHAVRVYFQKGGAGNFAKDALTALKKLATLKDLPQEIRHTAARLVARETDAIGRTTHPLEDAWKLIQHFFPTRPDGRPWRP